MNDRIDVELAQTNSGMSTFDVADTEDPTPFTDATSVSISQIGTKTNSALNFKFDENEEVSEFLKSKLGWRSLGWRCVESWDERSWMLLLFTIFAAPFMITGMMTYDAYFDPPRAYIDGCTTASGAAVAYSDCIICMGSLSGHPPYDPKSKQSYAGVAPDKFGKLVPWIQPVYDGHNFGFVVVTLFVLAILAVEATWIKFYAMKKMMSKALRHGVYITMPLGNKVCSVFSGSASWPFILVTLFCLSIMYYNNVAELNGFPIGKGPDQSCLAPSKYVGQKLNPWFFPDNPTNPTKLKAESGFQVSVKTFFVVFLPFTPVLISFWNFAYDNYSYISLSALLDSRSGARKLFSHIHWQVTYQAITNAALEDPAYVEHLEDSPSWSLFFRPCIGYETAICAALQDAQGFLQALHDDEPCSLKYIEEERTFGEAYCCC